MRKKSGLVYIAINPAFPSYFKIGNTTKEIMEERFYSFTSLPEDFEFIFKFKSGDINSSEKKLHNKFNEFRHIAKSKRKTEFFDICCLKKAVEYAKTIAKNENHIFQSSAGETIPKSRNKRSSFLLLNIPIGALLQYQKTDIYVKTVDDANQVEYKGKQMSISEATLRIWHELGKKSRTANGFVHFRYKGRPLRG
jgi:hypothetical protein